MSDGTHSTFHPTPRAAVNPFTRPAPAKPAAADQRFQREQRLGFAQDRGNAIVSPPRSEHDRRNHYIVRAQEAELLSEAADDQRIKVIHLEMAERYYSLANHHVERSAPMSLVR